MILDVRCLVCANSSQLFYLLSVGTMDECCFLSTGDFFVLFQLCVQNTVPTITDDHAALPRVKCSTTYHALQ